MSQLSDIRSIFAGQMATEFSGETIQWENTGSQLPTGAFYRFTFQQDQINQFEFGTYGRNERTGAVQVDIFEPLDHGTVVALTKTGDVEKAFPRGFAGAYNGMQARVFRTEVEHPLVGETHYHIPVSVYWRAWTQPY